MIKQISLFLAKILFIITLVILGSILILPNQTLAVTTEADYAHLTFSAVDPNNASLTGVYFYVYEQLTDISGQPVLGTKLASGYIDQTGIDNIKIKNSTQANINIAILYYKNSKSFEKFTLWNEYIYGTQSRSYTLRFSSAKIVLLDKNNNLLKTQSYSIYSTGIDALGNEVTNVKLYSGQKTDVLGYKTYYFVPGDYVVRVDKDYIFTVNKDIQTNVTLTINQVSASIATSTTATINLVTKDPQGAIVNKVNFAIYQQLNDANNNPVLGKKLTGGSITDTGFKVVIIKNTAGTTLNLAIVYYQTNNEFGKFYLYNQTVTGNEVKEIDLPFSGAKISITEPGGNIIKNYSFDLYANLKDANGSVTGTKKVLSSQKTGDVGTKTLYLIPNSYFITIKYINATDPETIGSTFTVNTNQITDFRYALGAINVSFSNTGNSTNKVSFKILKYRDGSYVSIGSYITDEAGNKRVVLPAGEYRLDSKISNSQYAEGFEFLINPGNERSYSFSQGSFHFRVVDGYRNPLPNLKISIYKYTNSKQGKVFSGTTDSNGEVIAALPSASYIADIDTAISGQKYQSKVFYVQDLYGTTYEYVVSMVRIYLQDNKFNNLTNQKFYLYNFATDANGNIITGKEIGNYTTNNLGYYDINLLAGRYIVKPVSATKIFAILVEAEKLNTFYLTAVINPTFVEPTPPVVADTTKTVTTPSTNTVYMASIYTNNDLYNKDTDHDTLADFEEVYIWHTNPNKADTDGDGYLDNTEIPNGYDPNGPGRKTYVIWAYDKPRVTDLRIEQKEAAYLKAELTRRLGYAPNISATNWNTLIKAFVYGGYTVSEIQNTVQYGPGLVHPTIPAYKWRVMRIK